jgi:hypothetical protein
MAQSLFNPLTPTLSRKEREFVGAILQQINAPVPRRFSICLDAPVYDIMPFIFDLFVIAHVQ